MLLLGSYFSGSFRMCSVFLLFYIFIISGCCYLPTNCPEQTDEMEKVDYATMDDKIDPERTLEGYINGHRIKYLEYRGNAFLQGDIHIGTADEMRQKTALYKKNKAEFIIGNKWSRNLTTGDVEIPYKIRPEINSIEFGLENIKAAIEHWNSHTIIKFIKKEEWDSMQDDYIEFRLGKGNYSWLGKKGGIQYVTLSKDGRWSASTVIHELGHAVGLLHEHSRGDRDKFVKIYWNNIKCGFEANFIKLGFLSNDHGIEYNYESIMHYGRNAFSKKSNCSSIVPKKNISGSLGGLILNETDIELIKKMYE